MMYKELDNERATSLKVSGNPYTDTPPPQGLVLRHIFIISLLLFLYNVYLDVQNCMVIGVQRNPKESYSPAKYPDIQM